MEDATNVGKEFFGLLDKDKGKLYSEDPNRSSRLHTSIDYANEKIHYRRDNLRHPCDSLEEQIQFWPEKPIRYREVIGKYSAEIITNGLPKSADHRVVTNSKVARTTIGSLITPSHNCHIRPEKTIIGSCSPPLYKDFIYKDFLVKQSFIH